jgi:hypothetical protein
MPVEYLSTRSFARAEPDAGEGRLDPAVRLALAGRGDELEILAAGQERVEARLLDDRTDPRQSLRALLGHRPSQQSHRARGRLREAQEHADERRLDGAVRAEIPERRPAADSQVDRVDGDPLAEALAQCICLDHIGVRRHVESP